MIGHCEGALLSISPCAHALGMGIDAEQQSPAIDTSDIYRLTGTDALSFVDRVLGPADSWASPLIGYRLTAESQADWKIELGQWLKVAEQNGFLERVLHDLRTQAQRPSRFTEIDANDDRHLKFHQHLAVARIAHYLTALDWRFEAFEPETGANVDVDLSLRSPSGEVVEFQVKAPDQPGRVENGKIVDGENDLRIVQAVRKAGRRSYVGPRPLPRSSVFVPTEVGRSLGIHNAS